MMAFNNVRPIFVLLALLALLVRPSAGYGRGAPDMACQDMVPRHGPNPQTSPAPFSIAPQQNQVEPGGTVTVRISSSSRDTSFRGFMLHAASPSNPQVSLGIFVNPPGNTRILTCSPGMQNAVTHADGSAKSSLDFVWQAPRDFQGEVLFRGTFVRDYATYWVQVGAQTPVRVGRSSSGDGYLQPTTYSRGPEPTPSYPAYYGPISSTTPSTTTRIVATSPWSFSTPAAPGSSSPLLPSVYQGCGETKGCFALHDSACIQQGTCSALLTYALKGTRYEFELWASNAPPNSYVAVGFSADNRMGDDSVTECTLVNGRVNAYMSFNEGKSNIRLRDAANGLSNVEARFTDGNLYCRFVRQSPFTVNGRVFDLSGSSDGSRPYIFLARGSATESGIGYHESQKSVSARPVDFAEAGGVGARSATLIKLHGAFMVAAWLFSASLGILFARYFRLTWVGKQFMGKDLWFVFHRVLMVITWALTIVAFVLIFVELGGWTSVPISTNPHSLIGVIVTILAFIQPIMAYFRPHPGTPKRFIFNWAHWLVGNSAHILAIVCIFLAVDLDKAAIPYWVNWLLVTWVAIHAFSHLILSLAQCCYHADGSRKSSVMAMRDLAPHQSNHQNSQFYSTQPDKKEDAHGSKFRRIVLVLYGLLVGSFSAAVIGTIVTGPWQPKTN